MKYTQIPIDTFKKLQRNAGILCTGFNPATGAITGILGATTGGFQFNASPSYTDLGDDVDNCPKDMMELKSLDSVAVTLAGTLLTIDATGAKMLMASADIDAQDDTHIIPRADLLTSDFRTIWWVGDYSDDNSEETGGFCAIKLENALNTGGFQIKSSDKNKGQFPFTFTGHVSMSNQKKLPYEVYIKSGASSVLPSIYLNKHTIELAVGDDETLIATVNNSTETPTWESDNDEIATVTSEGVVEAVASGNTIITVTLEDSGVTYTDTCTVIVPASAG